MSKLPEEHTHDTFVISVYGNGIISEFMAGAFDASNFLLTPTKFKPHCKTYSK